MAIWTFDLKSFNEAEQVPVAWTVPGPRIQFDKFAICEGDEILVGGVRWKFSYFPERKAGEGPNDLSRWMLTRPGSRSVIVSYDLTWGLLRFLLESGCPIVQGHTLIYVRCEVKGGKGNCHTNQEDL